MGGPYGRFIDSNHRKHGFGRVAVALAVTVASLMAALVPSGIASAAALPPGYWFVPFREGATFNGTHGSRLGPQGFDNGNPVYCIESGVPLGAISGAWQATADHNAMVGATMVGQHQGDMSDMTQAAVAFAVHDHLDQGDSHWSIYRTKQLENADINAVSGLAGQFWSQAEEALPSVVQASYKYTQAKRTGIIDAGIRNSSGRYVAGLSYTLVNTNNLVKFDQTGTNSISVTTNGSYQPIPWTAIGNGHATYQIRFSSPSAQKLVSAKQDLFSMRQNDPTAQGTIEFDVRRDFQPTVTTDTGGSRILARGGQARDRVTFGVAPGDEWVPGTHVTAKGYYFTGNPGTMATVLANGQGETPVDYLNRVKARLGQPAVTATLTTDHPGTFDATALKDGSAYTNPEDGREGDWLWAISKCDTPEAERVNVRGDWIDPFGKTIEAVSQQAHTSAWSEVAEPHAATGADIHDVIHIHGLPRDLGTFKGDGAFHADTTELRVKVWWAGASGGNTGIKEEDEKYRPSGSGEPVQDANHKLLRTADYDLSKLIAAMGPGYKGDLDIKVAGGKGGDPLADGMQFNVPAQATGYYTFTATYAGCDRATGFSSAYDDPYESTFVTREKPGLIDMTTDTSPQRVKVGERFHDTAHISGASNAVDTLTDGSYLEFTAYKAVPDSPKPDAGTLIDRVKVTLDAEQLQLLRQGRPIDVNSPETVSGTAGNVYWRASLHSADGTTVASHDLGLKTETTTITAGGRISSKAQLMGTVGEPLHDDITVGDGIDGNIPDGSTVTVRAYRYDGQPQASRDQMLAEKTYPVDTARLGGRGNGASYTFRADGFTIAKPGMVYWVATLTDPAGRVIDQGSYGEDTERTPVQEYSTTTSRKVASTPDPRYAEKTDKVYDVLHQTAYRQSDGDTSIQIGQTAKGTTYRFTLWRQGEGDPSGDRQVWQGGSHELPGMPRDGNALKTDQNLKSETVGIDPSWTPGTYYWRSVVTDRDGNTVWVSPQRVPAESFELVRVTSTSAEPLYSDTMHVRDTLHIQGRLPKGSSYKVELWKQDKHQGTAVEKIAETQRATLDHDVAGTDIKAPVMTNPGIGPWQFRFRVWSPDNHGGDPHIDPDSTIVSDGWKQNDGYPERDLIYEGAQTDSERFEVVHIDTDVTGTNNVHTSGNGHYVDVTDGIDVNDHATIKGHILPGYKLGFELWRKDNANHKTSETYPYNETRGDTLKGTTPAITTNDGQTDIDGEPIHITDPGDYYWVATLTKPDGTAFMPDGVNPWYAKRNEPSELFHAIRVTTSTYKWSSNGGTTQDTAKIEGWADPNGTLGFELHHVGDDRLVSDLKGKPLKDFAGYDADAFTNTLTSDPVKIPDAADYVFEEHYRLPADATDLHHGKPGTPSESFRAIDAVTDVATEFELGTAVSDHTDLTNVRWKQSGDIRDDLKDGLDIRWNLWKQGQGDESTDTKLATTGYTTLASGQTEAVSSKQTPTQIGIYYWQVEVSDHDTHKAVKLGTQREPRETFRIIKATSEAETMQIAGHPIADKVTITGPVAEGTQVSWTLTRDRNDGTQNDVASWPDVPNGSILVTKTQAEQALKDGKTTIDGPQYERPDVGGYHWVFSLTAPRKNLAGDGEPVKPGMDGNGNPDGSHLENQPFYTDSALNPDETTQVITVNTTTDHESHTGEPIHDTALFDGHVAEGTRTEFRIYKQDSGNDPSKDVLMSTTKRQPVAEGTVSVESPEWTPTQPGRYYWRNVVYRPASHKGGIVQPEPLFVGPARISSESVDVVRVTTTTERVAEADAPIHDTARIEGTVHDGQYLVFRLYRQEQDNNPKADKLVWNSKHIMLKTGQKTATSPETTVKKTGTYYWRAALYHSNPVQTRDTNADLNTEPDPADQPIHTGAAREAGETVDLVKVTTKADPTGMPGLPIHDTAYIQGTVPDGYQLVFELWDRHPGDVSKDTLNATTKPVDVYPGATKVRSPGVNAGTGDHYWREKLIRRDNYHLVSYGKPRVADESVHVASLAITGTGVLGIALLTIGLSVAGILIIMQRRRLAGMGGLIS
ncbi:hypothetical protein PT279_07740 [Bifidobacterium sp. ESL0784]|uniref:hypothetical protein n=1 Tax=Bifidobacterium sp. ESL0784 TaxID=2983231 RepID=UPI0023F7659E|nr:hypothetical protein [Bifidobacterium sp. ESL0784]MDF7641474.1 hypothetical protein [Bifidobacterium sp. ESL0784]